MVHLVLPGIINFVLPLTMNSLNYIQSGNTRLVLFDLLEKKNTFYNFKKFPFKNYIFMVIVTQSMTYVFNPRNQLVRR